MQTAGFAFGRAALVIATVLLVDRQNAGASDGSTMKVETIKIRNEVCEAEITVRPFVHLLSFHFLGAKNHLLNFSTPNPMHDGKPVRPDFIVGGKLWYAPEIADSHKFGMLAGKVTQSSREVNATLDADPISHLQGHIRFALDETRALLTISSSIKNVGTTPRELSCWWPVSFEPGGLLEAVPMAAPQDPAYSYHFWSYGGAASEPACHIGKDLVTLDTDKPLLTPVFKIGFMSREIVLRAHDCVFRLSTVAPDVSWNNRYPHGGSPVMLYYDQHSGFCEAELSGPMTSLSHAEEANYVFSIALEKIVGK